MSNNELLKLFPIFSDIPLKHLTEITRWCKVSEFGSNETIFQVGDKAIDFYGVVNGEVELSLIMRDSIMKTDIRYEEFIQTQIEPIEKVIIVDSLEPGEIFGWSAFVEPRQFTSTAKCSRPSKIIALPTDKLEAIFNNNPHVGYIFMKRLTEIISQRLRNRTGKLIESWSQAFDVNRV